jgi:hypothetical protein
MDIHPIPYYYKPIDRNAILARMKTIRTLFIITVTISLSGSCKEEFKFSFHENVNLGTQITFTNDISRSQFALTHVTNDKLIIGREQPKLIDINTKTVTDIALNPVGLFILGNGPQVKATETHLWNIY